MKPTPPDSRSPKEVWDEQHRLLAAEPLSWLLKAESLVAAFEVLIADDERLALEGQPERRIQSVAYMLAGFAIENLLKGLLVARESPVEKDGKFKFATHDLRQLAQDAGYELDESENRLLERVQEFTVWTGRYPVPIESDSMRPRTTPEGCYAPRTYHQLGQDWPAIRGFFSRFKNELKQVMAG